MESHLVQEGISPTLRKPRPRVREVYLVRNTLLSTMRPKAKEMQSSSGDLLLWSQEERSQAITKKLGRYDFAVSDLEWKTAFQQAPQWCLPSSQSLHQQIHRTGVQKPSPYDVLNPNEIRLLTLDPAKDKSACLRCTLSCHVLGSVPPYEALSYTWGSWENSKVLRVNRQDIKITFNLWTALRQLRHRTIPRVLWVDSICINQSDIAEKSNQIPLMRQIFEEATEVLMWIGNESNTSAAALEVLSFLSSHLKPIPTEVIKDTIARDRDPEDKRYKENIDSSTILVAPTWGQGFESLGDTEPLVIDVTIGLIKYLASSQCFFRWEKLDILLRRPWFSRAWVLQEVAVASKARIHIGQKSIAWETFEKAGIFILRIRRLILRAAYRESLQRGRKLATVFENCDTFLSMIVMRFGYRSMEPPPVSLASNWTSRLQATDPRDKVYAILAMLKKFDITKVQVDYSKPVREIYIDFAIQVLLQSRSLSLLSLASQGSPRKMQGGVTGLPSWVPHFEGSSQAKALDVFLVNMLPSIYHASYADLSPLPFRFSNDRQSLIVHGFYVGTIAGRGNVCNAENVEQELQSALERPNDMTLPTLPNPWNGNDDQEDIPISQETKTPSSRDRPRFPALSMADLKSLVLERGQTRNCEDSEKRDNDGNSSGRPQQKPMLESVNAQRIYRTFFADQWWTVELVCHRLASVIAGVAHIPPRTKIEKENLLRLMREEMANPSFGRRFFWTTSTGQYGLAPAETEEGDIVAVLLGSSVPFVLRRVEGTTSTFHLIGECFTLNVMDGEAILEWLLDIIPLQEITLV